MTNQKMWYQSKALLFLLTGIAVQIYRYVKETYVPALPLLPDNIVDIIVTFLIGGGIVGRVVATDKIQKKLLPLLLLFCLLSGTAHADVFGPRKHENTNLKISATAADSLSYPDPGTIMEIITKIGQYAAPREGFAYDLNADEAVNYFASTLYTIPDTGISFSAGALNLDGWAASVDWNVGALIPAEDVPVLNLIEYLYVGAFAGQRKPDDDEWKTAYGPDAQLKFTF